MAKKELLVPFRNDKPCWWDGEVSDKLKVGEVELRKDGYYRKSERKANYEFEARMKIVVFTRGRSSVKLVLNDIDEPYPKDKYARKFEWEVFLSDAIETISRSTDMVVAGKWTFCKRGQNWGIKLIESI